jgi:hypothetical protein
MPRKKGDKITDPAVLERLAKAREKALEVRRANSKAKKEEKLLKELEKKKERAGITKRIDEHLGKKENVKIEPTKRELTIDECKKESSSEEEEIEYRKKPKTKKKKKKIIYVSSSDSESSEDEIPVRRKKKRSEEPAPAPVAPSLTPDELARINAEQKTEYLRKVFEQQKRM